MMCFANQANWIARIWKENAHPLLLSNTIHLVQNGHCILISLSNTWILCCNNKIIFYLNIEAHSDWSRNIDPKLLARKRQTIFFALLLQRETRSKCKTMTRCNVSFFFISISRKDKQNSTDSFFLLLSVFYFFFDNVYQRRRKKLVTIANTSLDALEKTNSFHHRTSDVEH